MDTFEFKTIFYGAEWMLKDYLHKLEKDDFDPCAVEKMKSVNNLLDYMNKKLDEMEGVVSNAQGI